MLYKKYDKLNFYEFNHEDTLSSNLYFSIILLQHKTINQIYESNLGSLIERTSALTNNIFNLYDVMFGVVIQ